MPYDPIRHHRRSTRYPGFDYASARAYFVTICAQDRAYVLSTIEDGTARFQPPGQAVLTAWNGLPERFQGLHLDAFIVMPNHVHGIVILNYLPEDSTPSSPVRARFIAPDCPMGTFAVRDEGAMNRAPTLGEVVRTFKAVSTRLIRTSVDPSFAWQRNYHDRIVRSDIELDRIRTYIDANPASWAQDPDRIENLPAPTASLRHRFPFG